MVRVSDPKQAQDKKTGLQRQERDIKVSCLKFGLEVVKTFQALSENSTE